MTERYNKIAAQLAAIGQSHLLRYYDSLSAAEQDALLTQLEHLDYSVLTEPTADACRGSFAPLNATTLGEIAAHRERFTEAGLAALRAGKVGAILLAGGQGSRLGFEKPKGMYNIGEHRTLYIFECLMNNLMDVVRQAEAWVPLFIMTSVQNGGETRAFFEAHRFFGYDPAHVFFFPQEELPTVTADGKMMLAEKHRVSTAPNGNGGWYASMARTGVVQRMKEMGIEWLNVFAVDNVLQRIADPCFIGAVLESGRVCGAKVVAKADPEERVGVLCLEDGSPSIVEYYEMTKEMVQRRNADGELAYKYGVILNYLFRVDRLDKSLDVHLPLHRAFKKLDCLDENGQPMQPDEPNAYKFETLALDMVHLQENCLSYEVDREKEFAPIKNATGVDSVDTARALLRKNGVEL